MGPGKNYTMKDSKNLHILWNHTFIPHAPLEVPSSTSSVFQSCQHTPQVGVSCVTHLIYIEKKVNTLA